MFSRLPKMGRCRRQQQTRVLSAPTHTYLESRAPPSSQWQGGIFLFSPSLPLLLSSPSITVPWQLSLLSHSALFSPRLVDFSPLVPLNPKAAWHRCYAPSEEQTETFKCLMPRWQTRSLSHPSGGPPSCTGGGASPFIIYLFLTR